MLKKQFAWSLDYVLNAFSAEGVRAQKPLSETLRTKNLLDLLLTWVIPACPN